MRRALLLSCAVLIGCGSDSTAPTSPFVGDWLALSIGGKPLPAVVFSTVTASNSVVATAYRREISIDPTGGLSFFNDSTLAVVTVSGNASTTSLARGGFLTWAAVNDTLVRLTQKSPCACVGAMFVTQDFYLQRDGSLTALLDGSAMVTVFRRK
jgi:hypothetical protein